MKCVVCRQGDPKLGLATITLKRGGSTVVANDVPAQICPDCGEEYLDAKVTVNLLRSAERLARSGGQRDVQFNYEAS
jgi:YgiT-type zinc finger domain-containing protein